MMILNRRRYTRPWTDHRPCLLISSLWPSDGDCDVLTARGRRVFYKVYGQRDPSVEFKKLPRVVRGVAVVWGLSGQIIVPSEAIEVVLEAGLTTREELANTPGMTFEDFLREQADLAESIACEGLARPYEWRDPMNDRARAEALSAQREVFLRERAGKESDATEFAELCVDRELPVCSECKEVRGKHLRDGLCFRCSGKKAQDLNAIIWEDNDRR